MKICSTATDRTFVAIESKAAQRVQKNTTHDLRVQNTPGGYEERALLETSAKNDVKGTDFELHYEKKWTILQTRLFLGNSVLVLLEDKNPRVRVSQHVNLT